MKLLEYIEAQMEVLKNQIESIETRLNRISNLRGVTALLGLIAFVRCVMNKDMLMFILFIICAILFLALVIYYDKIFMQNSNNKSKLIVVTKRKKRLTGEWGDFEETGEDFSGKNPGVEKDLDIFGENSLFQYLCTANTKDGKMKLAGYLDGSENNKKIIYERQDAVKELIKKQKDMIEFESLCHMLNIESDQWYEDFNRYLNSESKLIRKFTGLLAKIMPIVTILFGGLVLFRYNNDYSFILWIMLLFTQAAIAHYVTYKTNEVMRNVYVFCQNIENYSAIAKFIQNEKFESDFLLDLQERLGSNKISHTISELERIHGFIQIRKKAYVHVILQFFLMYDINCIVALEKWKNKYGDGVKHLFDVIGTIEAVTSLSMTGLVGKVSFPVFVEQHKLVYKATELRHPLIPLSKSIPNSIEIESGAVLITGSNMSGKTTFLRTLGLNAILAYAGAPVSAGGMEVSFMKILTSMRIQDDVAAGISSFYAEVLRIKEMIEHAGEKEAVLALIDEIFKGTNSADRIIGAKEVMKSLNGNNVIEVVSTHDFELCKLVEQNSITGSNYHFEEYYEDGKLCFDYKMRAGKCKTTNAQHILRMVGVIK